MIFIVKILSSYMHVTDCKMHDIKKKFIVEEFDVYIFLARILYITHLIKVATIAYKFYTLYIYIYIYITIIGQVLKYILIHGHHY